MLPAYDKIPDDESKSNSITVVVKDYSRRLWIYPQAGNQRGRCRGHPAGFYQPLGNKEPIDQITAWLLTVARNKGNDRKRQLAIEGFCGVEDGEPPGWMDILMDDRLILKPFGPKPFSGSPE
jgi:hypothetical protein